MIDGEMVTGSYLRRVLMYCCVAVVASSIGSLWTWTTAVWPDANPLTDGLQPALFSMGPAIAIVGAARLPTVAVVSVAGSLFVAMAVMWWLFASSESSTSALIFLWGWFIGVPVAAAIVITDRRRSPGTAPASGTSN